MAVSSFTREENLPGWPRVTEPDAARDDRIDGGSGRRPSARPQQVNDILAAWDLLYQALEQSSRPTLAPRKSRVPFDFCVVRWTSIRRSGDAHYYYRSLCLKTIEPRTHDAPGRPIWMLPSVIDPRPCGISAIRFSWQFPKSIKPSPRLGRSGRWLWGSVEFQPDKGAGTIALPRQ